MSLSRMRRIAVLTTIVFLCRGGLPFVSAERPLQIPESALRRGQVDISLSRVFARVGKTGLGHEHAIEGRIRDGQILLGTKENAGQIVFDMKSFRADSANARQYIGLSGQTGASTQRQVNANMFGKDVLNVAQFPVATYAIVSALPAQAKSRDGHPMYRLNGEFTLHGTTRPLEMNVEVLAENDRTHLRGAFRMKQTDFGITPYSKAFGSIGVADQLTIYGEIYIGNAKNVAQKTTELNR